MLTEIINDSLAPDYVIATPIWKERLDWFEQKNIQITHQCNPSVDKYFIAPESLDCSFYQQFFPGWKYKRISPVWLSSVSAYNTLMLSPLIYELFSSYSYLVICQTDAVLIRNISSFNMMHYDYIGSPWAKPVLVNKFKIYGIPYCGLILDILGLSCPTSVGNGGLSVRKTKTFLEVSHTLLNRNVIKLNEDAFWGYLGVCGTINVATLEFADNSFWEVTAQGKKDIPENIYGFHALHKWNPNLCHLLFTRYT